MRPRRIVSGGQTGADRGGLDAAIALGIEHGGWCPRGRRAEDGTIPDHYRLDETTSREYAVRTERNVVDSDATLIVTRGAPTGGTALTADVARRHGRPLLVVDLADVAFDDAVELVRDFVAGHAVVTLNIAGPRASKAATLQRDTCELLCAAFSD